MIPIGYLETVDPDWGYLGSFVLYMRWRLESTDATLRLRETMQWQRVRPDTAVWGYALLAEEAR